MYAVDFRLNGCKVGLRKQKHFSRYAKAPRPKLELRCGFLARDVKHGADLG